MDVDVVPPGERREEPCGHLSDAGTVAEQRGAVDRDPQGTDRRILPVDGPEPPGRGGFGTPTPGRRAIWSMLPRAEGSPYVRIRHLTNSIAAGLAGTIATTAVMGWALSARMKRGVDEGIASLISQIEHEPLEL